MAIVLFLFLLFRDNEIKFLLGSNNLAGSVSSKICIFANISSKDENSKLSQDKIFHTA